MQKFAVAVKQFVNEEDAPTMVEYGLMVALVAIACIIAVTAVGTNLSAKFTEIAGYLA